MAAALTGAVVEIEARMRCRTYFRAEFYRADLVGFMVTNSRGRTSRHGEPFHRCAARGGDGDEGAFRREHWVLRAATPEEVDLHAGTIVVDWPAELE